MATGMTSDTRRFRNQWLSTSIGAGTPWKTSPSWSLRRFQQVMFRLEEDVKNMNGSGLGHSVLWLLVEWTFSCYICQHAHRTLIQLIYLFPSMFFSWSRASLPVSFTLRRYSLAVMSFTPCLFHTDESMTSQIDKCQNQQLRLLHVSVVHVESENHDSPDTVRA